jgi:uroporphyrinogen III methyltransferase / synthase
VADSNKTLEGRRIIVTRAVEQSESLVAELRKNGATAIMLPMVSFAPPEDLAPLDDGIRNLHSFQWLFLTSQNALRALQERCAFLGSPLREVLEGVQIAAVGPATAEAAEAAGLKVTYVAQKHQGVSLAQELAERVKGQKILLPRSDRANRDLVQVLNKLQAYVTEVIAYKTIRPAEGEIAKYASEIERGADAILFFSPSAVYHLQDILGAAKFVILSRDAAFTAIGPVTEKALQATGVQRIISAKHTHVTAVIDSLVEFFLSASQLQAGAKRG